MENDRIERKIFIAASPETVWAVISQPAWWVGDAPGPDKVQADGSHVIAETKYGKFLVLIEQVDPPNYLACRWASSFPGEEPREGNSTLVEFMLTAKDGGTWLSVVESGFSSLAVPEEERHKFFKGNVKGWNQQLEALRKRVEQ
ncbi:SRPBCC domain-containing protein [Metabacillus sp. RGM 3146]|uniref:SRPBCC domain-containing protein n=1 Tax=Metabacillus sp. RGM 3146 TaxID=3401092 RepID=UPI003B9936BC